MPTTKKKKSTKTAKKCTCKKTTCKKTCKNISCKERNHVCLVAALSITAGILLCADAAMMMLA